MIGMRLVVRADVYWRVVQPTGTHLICFRTLDPCCLSGSLSRARQSAKLLVLHS